MIMFLGPLLLILLAFAALEAKKRGLSGGRVALLVVVGLICIVVA
ncbi:MAG: hypothetical protein QOK23_4112, partial [Gammaproteobacteria bacterium]|nr:hypothetical protein [Gammaproteobacteria bacterium]